MKNFKILSLLVFLGLTILGGSGNDVLGQGITFVDSFTEAKKLAKDQNKLIFVDAYASWCGPCRWMAANVFTDAGVGKFYNDNYINIKIDCEKGEGPKFASTYGVRAYPTMFILDAEGNKIKETKGAKPVEDFLEFGKAAQK